MDDPTKTSIRRTIGSAQGLDQVSVLRPSSMPVLDLQQVKASDLLGEVAKSRIMEAAHDFLRQQGQLDQFDFSLSFSLSW